MTVAANGRNRMREGCMQIRNEVQKFIVASEQLYKVLAEGQSLNVHEAETVRCCVDELLAEGKKLHPYLNLDAAAPFRD